MVMGLSMALHEQSVVDPAFGHVVNGDLAGYHVAAHADVAGLEADWLEGNDPHAGPLGSRGVGEIGLAGLAAAITSAVRHATGFRARELPLKLERLLG